MKLIFTSKMLRKVLILSCLIIGLMFVTSNNNIQTVQAVPCCSECPGGGFPENVSTVCEAQCGSYNPCYYECINTGYQCYTICQYNC